jgi:hypothetical protein
MYCVQDHYFYWGKIFPLILKATAHKAAVEELAFNLSFLKPGVEVSVDFVRNMLRQLGDMRH